MNTKTNPGVKPLRSTHVAVASLSIELGGGAAPSEIRLLPAGRFHAADGSGRPEGIPQGWLLDAAVAAHLVKVAAARASDYVIDFEHQSLHSSMNGQPAPAAGWYKRLEFRPGDGLYALGVRWTARAAALIAAGEYRYLSPVFSYRPDGAVKALGPAALTNTPALDGLTDLTGSAALSAFFDTHDEKELPMKHLLAALGLAETATEAEALAALTAIKSTHGTELAVLQAKVGQAPDPAKFVAVATLSAVQGELSTAQTELAALKATAHGVEVDKVVTAALAAGHLSPATEVWARDLGKTNLAALTAFIAAAPVGIKPGSTQTGGKDPAGGGTAVLTAEQVDLCTQMNISQEDFQKTLAAG